MELVVQSIWRFAKASRCEMHVLRLLNLSIVEVATVLNLLEVSPLERLPLNICIDAAVVLSTRISRESR